MKQQFQGINFLYACISLLQDIGCDCIFKSYLLFIESSINSYFVSVIVQGLGDTKKKVTACV